MINELVILRLGKNNFAEFAWPWLVEQLLRLF